MMRKNSGDRVGCGREELLVTVLYGEATPAERAEFEEHLAACASCEDEFAALGAVRRELGGWELGAVPPIRVEIRPGLVERIRRSFAILPLAARVAAAGACALLIMAVFNTEVRVGPDGAVSFTASLRPRPEAAPAAGLTKEQVEQIVAARADQAVRAQLVAYKEELGGQLRDLERQLAVAGPSDDVRRLTVQVQAQRRKIDQLERDLDRTAGYGGSDLFSVMMSPAEPGS